MGRINRRAVWIPLLVICLLTASHLWAQGKKISGERPRIQLEKNSLAWQIEELVKWLVKTRDLVPRPDACEPPCYVLQSMDLAGSVDKNRLMFTLKGGVIADTPVLVPIVGPPHRVILKNITINGQPAVVGFEKANHYYVRTGLRNFTIRGELALLNELSFTVPGPVNLFQAALSDGRVIEGRSLPGLHKRSIHLEMGKRSEGEDTSLPPVFQISRAVRIQKEITFEYRVGVRSGGEISGVELPLPHQEMVLDVPGVRGWKQENDKLLVPTAGRSVGFTVHGRLPSVGVFHPDSRSNYEWWLIESDVEHRVAVKTGGRQVDSTESPIRKTLSSSKLFLIGKKQEIEVAVTPLSTLEALAVVISSQARRVIWTRDGDLVAEDHIHYQNNGIDYVPVECNGRAIYFEVDGSAQKILSEDAESNDKILLPMQKGSHGVLLQSISKAKPSLFGGLLKVPNAAHGLTISRASLQLGFPSRIIPLWFSGGEGIRSPIGWGDLVCILLALILSLAFFKKTKMRIAGLIALAGLYFIFPFLFFAVLVVAVAAPLLSGIWRRLTGWKRWLGLGGAALAGLVAVLVVISAPVMLEKSVPLEGGIEGGVAGGIEAPVTAAEKLKTLGYAKESEEDYGQRTAAQQQVVSDQLGNVAFLGKNVVEGVTPVRLPLPDYDRSVSVARQLVTPERPLSPTLIYVTRTALLPLFLVWLFCAAFVLWRTYPLFREWYEKGREFLRQSGGD